MYDDMFAYVKRITDAVYMKGSIRSKVKADRFGHLERVYHWTGRLADEYVKETGEKVDKEIIQIAAIFHDVAYGIAKYPKRHSAAGAEVCRKYLADQGYPEERIDAICYLIHNHSDKKELLHKEDTRIELILLMEADLLEGAGAISIVGDIWQETVEEIVDYTYLYKHILKFSYEQTKYNPMRTGVGNRYWEEKQKLIHMFMKQLELDLGMDGE